MIQKLMQFSTKGRQTLDITHDITQIVHTTSYQIGMCHLFLKHTSASLILCENHDPDVRKDLETFMQSLICDGDPQFSHQAEGPDDMPAHIRTVLTQNSLSVPIENGNLALGTWQGIYLWEHRYADFTRQLIVTLFGNE